MHCLSRHLPDGARLVVVHGDECLGRLSGPPGHPPGVASGRDSGGAGPEECVEAFDDAGNGGTIEVDLPIERHEDVDSLDVGVIGAKGVGTEDVFVDQVFDGVGKEIEGTSGLRGYAASSGFGERGGGLGRDARERDHIARSGHTTILNRTIGAAGGNREPMAATVPN